MNCISLPKIVVVASMFAVSFATQADYAGSILNDEDSVRDGLALKDGKTLKEAGYSPYAGKKFPTRVLWGDTHLHTKLSLDARAFGVTLGPAEAYQLARGEEITTSQGEPVRLSRPLDWLVVSDHSDALGAMDEVVAGNEELLKDAKAKDWHDRINEGGDTALAATMEIIETFAGITGEKIPDVLVEENFVRSVWERFLATADEYTSQGDSPPLSVMSGLPPRVETICTGMSFIVTTPARPRRCYRLLRQKASTPRTCGAGWRLTSKNLVARYWPWRTMATLAMASCSPRSIRKPASA